MWSGCRDLNPGPQRPERCALTKLRYTPFGEAGALYPSTLPAVRSVGAFSYRGRSTFAPSLKGHAGLARYSTAGGTQTRQPSGLCVANRLGSVSPTRQTRRPCDGNRVSPGVRRLPIRRCRRSPLVQTRSPRAPALRIACGTPTNLADTDRRCCI